MNKKYILIVSLLCAFHPVFAQYWQQDQQFTMKVMLDEKAKLVSGTQHLIYTNNSPDTLDFLWYHIWPKAYSSKSSALFKQIEAKEDAEQTMKEVKSFGDLTGLNFTVNGQPATTSPHSNPQYIDVIKLNLPEALLPGGQITIETPFVTKLPSYFSRSGFAEEQYMLAQWFPRPATYDKTGWHEMPYLSTGEYYNEYGNYDVTITLPSDLVVGATGVLQTADELAQYKMLGRKNLKDTDTFSAYQPPAGSTKTLHFVADTVPDFAFFAARNFAIQYDTIQLNDGRVVDAFTYFKPVPNSPWNESLQMVKDATHFYSNAIGNYDYPVVQAIEGPKNNSSGGMEYPMITLITSPDAKYETLDAVIAHEVGHNWFMSMLGTNERDHAWMDEGLNSYYQFRYEAEKHRSNAIFGDRLPAEIKKLPVDQFQDAIYNSLAAIPYEAAVDMPSDAYTDSQEYAMSVYVKAALWVYIMEAGAGKEAVDNVFRNYFAEWKHKHPQPEDFKASAEKTLQRPLDNFFNMLKIEKNFGEN